MKDGKPEHPKHYCVEPCWCGHDWGSHHGTSVSPQCRWCPCDQYTGSLPSAPLGAQKVACPNCGCDYKTAADIRAWKDHPDEWEQNQIAVAALTSIGNNSCCGSCHEARLVALAALAKMSRDGTPLVADSAVFSRSERRTSVAASRDVSEALPAAAPSRSTPVPQTPARTVTRLRMFQSTGDHTGRDIDVVPYSEVAPLLTALAEAERMWKVEEGCVDTLCGDVERLTRERDAMRAACSAVEATPPQPLTDAQKELNGWRELGEEMHRIISAMSSEQYLDLCPDWFGPRLFDFCVAWSAEPRNAAAVPPVAAVEATPPPYTSGNNEAETPGGVDVPSAMFAAGYAAAVPPGAAEARETHESEPNMVWCDCKGAPRPMSLEKTWDDGAGHQLDYRCDSCARKTIVHFGMVAPAGPRDAAQERS